MFRQAFFFLLAASLNCSLVFGQEPPPNPADDSSAKAPKDAPSAGRFWEATLPGGEYTVALTGIISVSRHKYLLDGALTVDEVTVDCTGQALARFYFIAPISGGVAAGSTTKLVERGKELLDQGAGRISPDFQNMVVKKYPETTHARTIEYRLSSEAALTALFTSVKSAWESGRGRQFSAK